MHCDSSQMTFAARNENFKLIAINNNMLTDVILIGPYGAGKSTLGKLITDRLKWHYYALDNEGYHYLKEMEEYNSDIANQMFN